MNVRFLLKYHRSVTVFLLVCFFLSIPTLIFAQDPAESPATLVGNALYKLLWEFVVAVFGFLVWLGAQCLNFGFNELVLKFGYYFKETGLGVAVNSLWVLVRDLFNLAFIFGLIYIGFKMIINSDDSGAKRTIVTLVIAALLINFSLFISKSIIDFTNIAAIQVSRIQGFTGADGKLDVAQNLANNMGLASIYRVGSGGNTTPGLTYIFGTMFLFVIAAFAFAMGGVMLFARFIALYFFMILSPLMFIGLVVPAWKKYASDYWEKFLNYSFFAPILLLFIYFSTYVLQQFGSFTRSGSRPTVGEALSGTAGAGVNNLANSSSFESLALFGVACGFLLGSVMIANQMSIRGAKTAISVGNKMRGSAQSFVGRNTVGRAGGWVDKKLESRGWRSDSTIRGVAKSAKEAKYGGSISWKSASDTVDERDRFVARKKAVDTISGAVTAGIGAGATPDQKIAMEREISSASNEQVLKVLKGMKEGSPEYKALIAGLSASQYDALLKTKDEDLNDDQKAVITTTRQESITASLQERAVTKAANDARDTVLATAGGTPAAAEAAAAAARAGMSTDAAISAGIKMASTSQLKTLGERTLTQAREAGMLPLATELTFSQIDDIKKSSNDFTETEKERIINTHIAGLVSAFNTAVSIPGQIPTFLNKFKNEEVAKLPKSILNRVEIRDHLSPGALGELSKVLNPTERLNIRRHIENAGAFVPGPPPSGHIAYDWLNNTPQGRSF